VEKRACAPKKFQQFPVMVEKTFRQFCLWYQWWSVFVWTWAGMFCCEMYAKYLRENFFRLRWFCTDTYVLQNCREKPSDDILHLHYISRSRTTGKL